MESDVPLPPPPRIKQRISFTSTGTEAPNFLFSIPRNPAQSHSANPVSHSSSDPPVFSSDDLDAATMENYRCAPTVDLKRKRRYRGTWWGQEFDAKRKKTGFKNKVKVDSGVWLSSDDSNECFPSSSEGASLPGEERLVNCEKVPCASSQSGNVASGTKPPIQRTAESVRPLPPPKTSVVSRRVIFCTPVESEPHRRAKAIISQCLEQGNDIVDLAYFNMETIPPGTLRPLMHLIKQPAVKEAPLSDDVFGPLVPFLRLFLAHNLLTSLPAEIFQLQNLKVLSLRHNRLKEIPCAIRKLTMLQDLNIAANQLQHLPWEMLSLMQTGSLRRLTAYPNPFVSLRELDVIEWHCHLEEGEIPVTDRLVASTYSGQAPPEAWTPVLVVTSSLQLLDIDGFPIESRSYHQSASKLWNVDGATICPSNVPSLRELALRACSLSPHLSSFLESDDSQCPELVLQLLTRAKEISESGGTYCSVCFRAFVVPRTQWIEWWDCCPVENGLESPRKSGQRLHPLPFLRQGCSWTCLPVAGKSH